MMGGWGSIYCQHYTVSLSYRMCPSFRWNAGECKAGRIPSGNTDRGSRAGEGRFTPRENWSERNKSGFLNLGKTFLHPYKEKKFQSPISRINFYWTWWRIWLKQSFFFTCLCVCKDTEILICSILDRKLHFFSCKLITGCVKYPSMIPFLPEAHWGKKKWHLLPVEGAGLVLCWTKHSTKWNKLLLACVRARACVCACYSPVWSTRKCHRPRHL